MANTQCGGYIYSNGDSCRCMVSFKPLDGSGAPDGCSPRTSNQDNNIYWIVPCGMRDREGYGMDLMILVGVR